MGGRCHPEDRSRFQSLVRHASDSAVVAAISAAATCTSRMSPAIPPAVSSIAWRARCFCTRWPMAGCAKAAPSSKHRVARRPSPKRTSRSLLGIPFIAVMPAATSPEKIAAIEFHGGRCHLVDDAHRINAESARLARECGGHFMDQFTFAERATDWRANNNIAESIFKQMAEEPYPIPEWIVCGAGTGGTSATLGRYVRYRRHCTRILCADPQTSVFYDFYRSVLGNNAAARPDACRKVRASKASAGRVSSRASFPAASTPWSRCRTR